MLQLDFSSLLVLLNVHNSLQMYSCKNGHSHKYVVNIENKINIREFRPFFIHVQHTTLILKQGDQFHSLDTAFFKKPFLTLINGNVHLKYTSPLDAIWVTNQKLPSK